MGTVEQTDVHYRFIINFSGVKAPFRVQLHEKHDMHTSFIGTVHIVPKDIVQVSSEHGGKISWLATTTVGGQELPCIMAAYVNEDRNLIMRFVFENDDGTTLGVTQTWVPN